MLIAFVADIHANRQAFEAVLSHAEAAGAKRFVFLGDHVGYGADPVWTVETLMRLTAEGAVAILGNHDVAAATGVPDTTMGSGGVASTAWTHSQLSDGARAFLASLPLQVRDGERLYVHTEASAPGEWRNARNAEAAARSMAATDARVTLCGHTHKAMVYGLTATAKMNAFEPATSTAVPLQGWRRWHVTVGTAGRLAAGKDAAYVLYDTAKGEAVFLRVPYDWAAAEEAIRAAGLPS